MNKLNIKVHTNDLKSMIHIIIVMLAYACAFCHYKNYEFLLLYIKRLLNHEAQIYDNCFEILHSLDSKFS